MMIVNLDQSAQLSNNCVVITVAGPSRLGATRAESSHPANSQISTALPPPSRREQYASSPKVHRTNSVVSQTAAGSVRASGLLGSVYGASNHLSMQLKAEVGYL
jgi:hypothetical protein